ncbi:uncharacterized protein CTRU02_205767 [Colletotrichum truncatum]|uniref:Uncharacterized protein n=1 Tax=Colletotrichum truncatum TaxID=5467 RepID=A0ACC3Z4Y5_COLTU|nr:uncharacterized protein CTRU02_09516 [Colletotrichum truncatum]KAF6788708.1 hypothetical protein CTRU02_09516 [Colletotrichum truncatum]
MDELTYRRDAIAKSLTKYYETLARACYFSPTDIQSPPPEGWSDSELDIDALRSLGRSDKAIDFLRHLPYIKPLKNSNIPIQWPVLIRSRAIRYLQDGGDFSKWSSRGEEGLSELSCLSSVEPFAGLVGLPPHEVSLTTDYGSGFIDSISVGQPRCIIDCEKGVLPSEAARSLRTIGGAFMEDTQDAAALFEDMTSKLLGGNHLALPPIEDYEPEIMSPLGDDLMGELWKRIEWIYKSHGWYSYDNDPSMWRRDECLIKLKEFRTLMWEADKKKVEFEQNLDDDDDENYQGNDMCEDKESKRSSVDDSDEELNSELDISDIATEDLEAELAELLADQNEPSMEVDPNYSEIVHYDYSRDAAVDVVERYYKLLSHMAYFPPDLLECAPESGWCNDKFPLEKLVRLGYSDKVIDLLRYLPYLARDKYHWQLFKDSEPKRYLNDARPFAKIPTERLNREKLYKFKLSPYKDCVLPPEMVVISASADGVWGSWLLLNTETGALYIESLSNRKSWDPPESQPWLRNQAVPIVPFFEDLIYRAQSLEIVPVPGEDLELNLMPGIWAEPDWFLGRKVLARMGTMDQRILIPNGKRWGIEDARRMYRRFHWPDLENFRRDECLEALAQLHHDLVYPRKNAKDEV